MIDDDVARSADPRRLGPSGEGSSISDADLDVVLQRLFALGLTVQSVATALGDSDRARRLERAVADIDETIRHLRDKLSTAPGATPPSEPPTEALEAGPR